MPVILAAALAAAFPALSADPVTDAAIADAQRRFRAAIEASHVNGTTTVTGTDDGPCLTKFGIVRPGLTDAQVLADGLHIRWWMAEGVEFRPGKLDASPWWQNYVAVRGNGGEWPLHPEPAQVGPMMIAAHELMRLCKGRDPAAVTPAPAPMPAPTPVATPAPVASSAPAPANPAAPTATQAPTEPAPAPKPIMMRVAKDGAPMLPLGEDVVITPAMASRDRNRPDGSYIVYLGISGGWQFSVFWRAADPTTVSPPPDDHVDASDGAGVAGLSGSMTFSFAEGGEHFIGIQQSGAGGRAFTPVTIRVTKVR